MVAWEAEVWQQAVDRWAAAGREAEAGWAVEAGKWVHLSSDSSDLLQNHGQMSSVSAGSTIFVDHCLVFF